MAIFLSDGDPQEHDTGKAGTFHNWKFTRYFEMILKK